MPPLSDTKIFTGLRLFFAVCFSVAVLAAWGAVSLFRSPKGDFKAYLIPFVIFAACCVYLVMEVQPRYAYVGQIALFILMAGGVEALCSLAAGLLQKKKLPHKKPS